MIEEAKREERLRGDFKQFTPSTMYYRGGKVANSGLLRQPYVSVNGSFGLRRIIKATYKPHDEPL
jgi:hypothetical protein